MMYSVISAIDGKKYREVVSFGFPFLSRHKESCRKREANGDYVMSEREVKRDGKRYDICTNCGYEISCQTVHDL